MPDTTMVQTATSAMQQAPIIVDMVWHIGILLAIMIAMGMFGGLVGYYTMNEDSGDGEGRDKPEQEKSPGEEEPSADDETSGIPSKGTTKKVEVLRGLAAAFVTPLFLQLISSNLLDSTRRYPDQYLIFAGLCLVAAITARSFIASVSRKALRLADDARNTAAGAAAKAAESAKGATSALAAAARAGEMATTNVRALAKASTEKLAMGGRLRGGADVQAPATPSAAKASDTAGAFNPLEGTTVLAAASVGGSDSDDPNKGRFGGKSVSNGRELTASIAPYEGSNVLYRLNLKVAPVAGAPPITGTVTFVLHPSFSPHQMQVEPSNGIAEGSCLTWGAFTVGALVEGEPTRLELDLATLKGAPKEFCES